MTEAEVKEVFDMLRANGDSDDVIVAKLYLMFVDGLLNVEQLGALVDMLGYSLREDFLKLSPEEQKQVALRNLKRH